MLTYSHNPKKPILSIIIPVYNTQKYLRECLDSIINQTLKEIEIIIINDCTPDNSEKIILEYADKDSRITYIRHEINLGLGGARNTGISIAKASYVTFVDSDDYVSRDCYSNMIKLIEYYHADCCVFSAEQFDDTTGAILNDSYFTCITDRLERCTAQNMFSFTATVWNKIFKRKDLIKNNIWFPYYLYHEDEEFWFKYTAKVQPLIISNQERYYHYRKHGDSITSNIRTSRQDLPHILSNIYGFLVRENLFKQYKSTFLELLSVFYSYRECFKYKHLKKLEQDFKPFLEELNQRPIQEILQNNPSSERKLISVLKEIKIYSFICNIYRMIKKLRSK